MWAHCQFPEGDGEKSGDTSLSSTDPVSQTTLFKPSSLCRGRKQGGLSHSTDSCASLALGWDLNPDVLKSPALCAPVLGKSCPYCLTATSRVFLFVCLFLFLFFTDSISLLVISLFIFSISSCFHFGRLYVPRNLSIFSRLSNLLAYRILQYSVKLCVNLWCWLLFLLFLYNFIYLSPISLSLFYGSG